MQRPLGTLVLATGLTLLTTPAQSQECVDYLAHLRVVDEIPTPGRAIRLAHDDTYLYVGDFTAGVTVLSLADPWNPVIIAQVPPITLNVRSVLVVGDRLYAADASTIGIVDITDPTAPSLVTAFELPDNPWDLDYESGYLYAATSAGLCVFDLTNPDAPVLVDHLIPDERLYGVDVSGDYAYTASAFSNLMHVLDVSSPGAAFVAGSFWHEDPIRDVVVQDGFAYVATWGVITVDVTDPTDPSEVHRLPGPQPVAPQLRLADGMLFGTGGNDLLVRELSEPSSPATVGRLPDGDALDFVANGDVGYLASDFEGVKVVDLSDPTSPGPLAHVPTQDRVNATASLGSIVFVGDNEAGIQIVDMTDPSVPTIVRTLEGVRARDFAIRAPYLFAANGSNVVVLDTSDPATTLQVAAINVSADLLARAGDRLYLTGGYGVVVVDISDPLSPQVMGSVGTDDSVRGVAAVGENVFVTTWGVDKHLVTIDASSPTSPFIEGMLVLPGWVGGLDAVGDLVYVASRIEGLHVIDVSDMENPVMTGTAQTANQAHDVAVDGELAFVADEQGGLQVVDVSDPLAPYVISSILTDDDAEHVYVGERFVTVAARFGGADVFLRQCGAVVATSEILTPPPPMRLGPIAPNPVRATATVEFVLDRPGAASLSIYDVAGRLVQTVEQGNLAAGQHRVPWTAVDAHGRRLPGGVYFISLEVGGAMEVRQAVVSP